MSGIIANFALGFNSSLAYKSPFPQSLGVLKRLLLPSTALDYKDRERRRNRQMKCGKFFIRIWCKRPSKNGTPTIGQVRWWSNRNLLNNPAASCENSLGSRETRYGETDMDTTPSIRDTGCLR